jgi:Flp pilus assembly protein TadD
MDTSCIQQQLQRTQSNGSLHKASSVRLNEESLTELSLSRTDSSKKASSEQLKQAEMYHSQGWEARKRQDFKGAIELYSKALELNPQHFKAYFNRGFAYDKVG